MGRQDPWCSEGSHLLFCHQLPPIRSEMIRFSRTHRICVMLCHALFSDIAPKWVWWVTLIFVLRCCMSFIFSFFPAPPRSGTCYQSDRHVTSILTMGWLLLMDPVYLCHGNTYALQMARQLGKQQPPHGTWCDDQHLLGNSDMALWKAKGLGSPDMPWRLYMVLP